MKRGCTLPIVAVMLLGWAAPAQAEPSYASVKLKNVAAPALPKPCGSAHPFADHLLIFSSRYCAACDTYLRELAELKDDLRRRKVSVLVCVVDEVSCAQATRDSFAHGSWPVCVADATVQKAWGGVAAQPTTFVVADNRVHWVLKGRPPVASLLAEIDEIRRWRAAPKHRADRQKTETERPVADM
jgi:thiol-disulfide isomerase/thioredoxin